MSEIIEVRIPFSGSVENVEINEWLIAVGDTVQEGDPMADVSTDKVDTELVAPASGKVVRLLADTGTEIKVGTPVALLAAPGATDDDVDRGLAGYVPGTPD